MHPCHLFVCSAPAENNCTGVTIVTMKLLIAAVHGVQRVTLFDSVAAIIVGLPPGPSPMYSGWA